MGNGGGKTLEDVSGDGEAWVGGGGSWMTPSPGTLNRNGAGAGFEAVEGRPLSITAKWGLLSQFLTTNMNLYIYLAKMRETENTIFCKLFCKNRYSVGGRGKKTIFQQKRCNFQATPHYLRIL